MNTVMKSLSKPPVRCSIMGDSTCVIAACDINANALQPYFSNRVVEIVNTMASWGAPAEVKPQDELQYEISCSDDAACIVDPLQHIPGIQNIADLPSRGNVALEEIGPGSAWQVGPKFIAESRNSWPINDDFVRQVPESECRKKFLLAAMAMKVDMSKTKIKDLMGIMEKSNSIARVRQVMARLCRASRFQSRDQIKEYPGFQDFQLAEKLMQCLAMFETSKMLIKYKLESLLPFRHEGRWYTRGRLAGKSLMKHLGHDKLLLLSNQSRYAELLLIAAHERDHRLTPGDALHRTREDGVWIVRGLCLAKKVVNSCRKCKILAPKLQQQQMAELPLDRFEVPTRPFRYICVDFLAPVTVRCTVKKRVTMKAFPLVITCLHTEALHPTVCENYSTDEFLKKFKACMSFRGTPIKVITDLGSQLCKAGKVTAGKPEEPPHADKLQWKRIQSEHGAKGIEWYHAPAATAWRNGRAEAMVKLLKKSLGHLQETYELTFSEYADLLSRAAGAINSRPLGIRHQGGAEPDIEVITPNLLLIGSRCETKEYDLSRYEEDNSIYTRRYRFTERMYQEWWKLWQGNLY